MKSLFANEEIILPSWLKILMETIDSETIQKLSENQEYRKMQIRRKELLEHYPIIEKVIDDEGKVSISEQEHKALLEYFLVKDRMENEERLYHYLYGHAVPLFQNQAYSILQAWILHLPHNVHSTVLHHRILVLLCLQAFLHSAWFLKLLLRSSAILLMQTG